LANFLSPIRRHRRHRALVLLRRHHPPRLSPSVAPSVLFPPGFSATVGLPESAVHRSANALATRHAAGTTSSASETRSASSPTRPGLRGSSSPYSLRQPPPHPPPPRRPPRPPGLHRRCALRALPSGRPACRRLRLRINIVTSSCCLCLQLTVVLPNVGRGAPLGRRRTPTLPGYPQIGSC
jgi:hypothetical protein